MSNTIQPIKTAICSFGMSGWVFHAPFIAVNPGFELYSVCERTKNLASLKYPAIKTVRSLEELLEDDAVELVVVNTPNSTHYEYTKKALLAGKHVIVEKPFTIYSKEGDELIQLAAQCGKQLSVYHNRRYDSDTRTVKKILDEQLLGEIVETEIRYDRYREEIGPKLHKETPGPGTGLVYDLGAHLIDQALLFFGMPQSIFADIGILRPVSKVDDYMELLLFYGRLRVRLKSGYLVREPLPAYSINGTKGSFIKARTDVQEAELQAGESPGGSNWGVEPADQKGLLHTEIDGKIIREQVVSLSGNYGDYYNAMYDAIRNNAPVPVTGEHGTNVIRVIEAAYESNREKKIINL